MAAARLRMVCGRPADAPVPVLVPRPQHHHPAGRALEARPRPERRRDRHVVRPGLRCLLHYAGPVRRRDGGPVEPACRHCRRRRTVEPGDRGLRTRKQLRTAVRCANAGRGGPGGPLAGRVLADRGLLPAEGPSAGHRHLRHRPFTSESGWRPSPADWSSTGWRAEEAPTCPYWAR